MQCITRRYIGLVNAWFPKYFKLSQVTIKVYRKETYPYLVHNATDKGKISLRRQTGHWYASWGRGCAACTALHCTALHLIWCKATRPARRGVPCAGAAGSNDTHTDTKLFYLFRTCLTYIHTCSRQSSYLLQTSYTYLHKLQISYPDQNHLIKFLWTLFSALRCV